MKKSDFKPTKIRLSDGGVSAKFDKLLANKQGDVNTISNDISSTIPCHPDLTNAFAALEEHLQKIAGLKDRENLEVYQISMSGEDENSAVIITGKRDCLNGRVIAMNTPRITEDDADYGKAKQLHEAAAKIIDEAYEYLYKCKFAQKELFDKALLAE